MEEIIYVKDRGVTEEIVACLQRIVSEYSNQMAIESAACALRTLRSVVCVCFVN